MVLDRKSAQKFASLSALGISALAIGAQSAKGDIIYSGPIDLKLGFDSGYAPGTITQALGGTAAFKFTAHTVVSGPVHHKMSFGGVSVKWAYTNTGGHLDTFGSGKTMTNGVTTLAQGFMAVVTAANQGGLLNVTSRYALFKFPVGAQTDFGWVLFSEHGHDNPGETGPNLDVLGYAYDDSGAKIDTGETSAGAGTPEPATFALTGLAMMSLGAAGVRRYRKARKTANIES